MLGGKFQSGAIAVFPNLRRFQSREVLPLQIPDHASRAVNVMVMGGFYCFRFVAPAAAGEADNHNY